MPKYWGKFISATGVSPKWVKCRRHRKRKEKMSVKTMASFASIRHHKWRTQAAWTKRLTFKFFFNSSGFGHVDLD